MQGNIGGIKAAEWVEQILSRSHRVRSDSMVNDSNPILGSSLIAGEPQEVVARRKTEIVSGTTRSTNIKKSEGPGQLAQELNEVIQPTRPPEVLQSRTVYKNDRQVLDKPKSSDSDTGIVYLSSVSSSSDSDGQERSEIQARANERVARSALSDAESRRYQQVNPKEVADRVYKLMQKDLLLIRDRAMGVGG